MDHNQSMPALHGFGLMDGFNELERDMLGPFVWTKRTFRLRRPFASKYLAVKMCYYGQGEKLYLKDAGRIVDQVDLYPGWQRYAIDLSGVKGLELDFELSRTIPVVGDTRQLGLMIRHLQPFEQSQRYRLLGEILANKQLNRQEYLQGQTVLSSSAPSLGINLTSRCNIKPRCVYCEWDWAKGREKQCDSDLTVESLARMGRHYRLADEILDQSYGEPLMHQQLGQMLDAFDSDWKYSEMGSNGQLLNRPNRRKLLGKDMTVYVSVDSSNSSGYQRYRNNRFDKVIGNIRKFCREKKRYNNSPRVIIAFIAMRSNIQELEGVLDLGQELGVDSVRLASLDLAPHLDGIPPSRNGFRFDYDAETLGLAELQSVVDRGRRASAAKGVNFMATLDCGQVLPPEGAPICSQPWQRLFMLKRGFMPCSSAREPLMEWSQKHEQDLEQFLEEVFNSRPFQELRSSLAQGQLPPFCLNCKCCPIVKVRTRNSRQTRLSRVLRANLPR